MPDVMVCVFCVRIRTCSVGVIYTLDIIVGELYVRTRTFCVCVNKYD